MTHSSSESVQTLRRFILFLMLLLLAFTITVKSFANQRPPKSTVLKATE